MSSRSTIQFHDAGDSRTFLTPVPPPQDLHGSSGRINRLRAPPLRLLLELRPSAARAPLCDPIADTAAPRFHLIQCMVSTA